MNEPKLTGQSPALWIGALVAWAWLLGPCTYTAINLNYIDCGAGGQVGQTCTARVSRAARTGIAAQVAVVALGAALLLLAARGRASLGWIFVLAIAITIVVVVLSYRDARSAVAQQYSFSMSV